MYALPGAVAHDIEMMHLYLVGLTASYWVAANANLFEFQSDFAILRRWAVIKNAV